MASSIETIVVAIIAMATSITVFVVIDPVFTSIVLMLMTPYYPDHRYYQRIYCCLICIKCCDRKGESTATSDFYTDTKKSLRQRINTASQQDGDNKVDLPMQSQADTPTPTIKDESIDTLSQIRVLTQKIGLKYFKNPLGDDYYDKFIDSETGPQAVETPTDPAGLQQELVEFKQEEFKQEENQKEREQTAEEENAEDQNAVDIAAVDREMDAALGSIPDPIIEALSKETSTVL